MKIDLVCVKPTKAGKKKWLNYKNKYIDNQVEASFSISFVLSNLFLLSALPRIFYERRVYGLSKLLILRLSFFFSKVLPKSDFKYVAEILLDRLAEWIAGIMVTYLL